MTESLSQRAAHDPAYQPIYQEVKALKETSLVLGGVSSAVGAFVIALLVLVGLMMRHDPARLNAFGRACFMGFPLLVMAGPGLFLAGAFGIFAGVLNHRELHKQRNSEELQGLLDAKNRKEEQKVAEAEKQARIKQENERHGAALRTINKGGSL